VTPSRFLRLRKPSPSIPLLLAMTLMVSGFTALSSKSEASDQVVPTITSTSPSKLPLDGGQVTLTGTDFLYGESVTVVRLDELILGVSENLVVSATEVTFTAPSTETAGTRVIGIKVGDAQEVTTTLVFTPFNPVVTAVSSSSGVVAGGEEITITGSGFSPGGSPPVSVTIGRFPTTDLVVDSDTQIRVKTPVRTGNDLEVGAFQVHVTVGAEGEQATSSDPVYFSFAPKLGTISTGTVILEHLASRSQRKPVIRSTVGPPYLVEGSETVTRNGVSQTLPYSYFTDVNYVGHVAYGFESDERSITTSWNTSNSKQSTTFAGKPAMQLSSSGSCTGQNFFDGKTTYCSVFGPEVYSESFFGKEGQSIAFEWAANAGNDDYEVYAFLVNQANQEHTILLHSLGRTRGWTTSAGNIPADGVYQFRFVNGSYDATGGFVLGSNMYLSPSAIVGEPNSIEFSYSGGNVERFSQVTVTATATSGQAVTLAPSNAAICEVASSSHSSGVTSFQVTAKATGTCVLNASQGAVGVFSPAPTVQQSFTVVSAPIAETVTPTPGLLNIRVTWSAVTGASGFFVEHSIDGSTWIRHNSTETNVRDVTIPNLTPINQYRFRVIAVVSGVERNPSIPTSQVRPLVPPPSNVLATSAPGVVSVSWTAAESAEGYTVEYSSDAGSTWTVFNQTQVESPPVSVADLNPSSEFVFRVKAHIGPGASTYASSTEGVSPGPISSGAVSIPQVAPSPSPTSTPRPRPTPTRTPAIVTAPLSPSVLPSPTPTQTTPVPAPNASPVPVVMPTLEPTPGVVFSPRNPIPQAILDVLAAPLAYVLAALNNNPELPALAPTESLAYENGSPVVIQLVRTDEDNGYLLIGDGWQVALEATDTSGEPLRLDESGNIILNQDRFVQFSGTGFAPGSIIRIWLFSDPTELGDVIADASGNFVGQAQLPQGIPTGEHTVQLNGLTKDGQLRSVSLGVVVQPDLVVAPAAPVGFDLSGLLNFLWLIATGVLIWFFIVWRRRKKKVEEGEIPNNSGFEELPIFASEGFEPTQQFPNDSRRKIGAAAPPNRKRFGFKPKDA